MKKRFTISKQIILLVISALAMMNSMQAQTLPKTFNYQAVARTNEGYPIADKQIVVEISILKGTNCDKGTSCPVIWQETHTPTTNEFGLFSIEIGVSSALPTGLHATGINSFSDINWNDITTSGQYYVKIRVDFGDSEFINGLLDMGTSKLQAVPYARVAEVSQSLSKNTSGKVAINLGELNDVTVSSPILNQALVWSGTAWQNQTLNLNSNLYLTKDGTTDLTGNWTISNNNLTMTNGKFSMTNGSAVLSTGSIFVNNGVVHSNFLRTAYGPAINKISIDGTFAGNSDLALPTEKAVKTYVDALSGGGFWLRSGSSLYNIADDIGIGTSTPFAKFHASIGESDFFVQGTFNSINNSITSRGPGTRMIFSPKNSTFRVGTVQSTQWDDAYVGDYSAAFGLNTTAKGDYSFAQGANCRSYANYSITFGNSNTAGDISNVSMGEYAVSFGQSNTSSGNRSFTMGNNNIAAGLASTAFGTSNTANGAYSFVGGLNSKTGTNTSEGAYSFGFGNTVQTKGDFSFAIGSNSISVGNNSFACGDNTYAGAYQTFVLGQWNSSGFSTGASNLSSWVGTDAAFVIGNGTSTVARSDAFYILKNGNGWMAGTLTQASDERLKKNITPLESSLEKLMQIQGVNYYWNADVWPAKGSDDELQIGLTAQNVEKIFPLLVKDFSGGYKSVNYIGFIPIIIESVKTQQHQIESLKSENSELKAKTNTQKQEIEDLKLKFNELNQRLLLIEKALNTTK